jgi:hypothetical protein
MCRGGSASAYCPDGVRCEFVGPIASCLKYSRKCTKPRQYVANFWVRSLGKERGVYAASSFGSPKVNRFVHAHSHAEAA